MKEKRNDSSAETEEILTYLTSPTFCNYSRLLPSSYNFNQYSCIEFKLEFYGPINTD